MLKGFGDWLGRHAFGPVGEKLLKRAPVTVRVVLPAALEELALRPFESARVGGRLLTEAGVTLVFEGTADEAKDEEQPVAGLLRMLAVFSLPPVGSPLNLREERQALRHLAHELAGAGRAIELRTLQYGTSRDTLREALEEGDGWDIVHLSGHGAPGKLYLEGEDGEIAAAELADLLRPSRDRLKLVTLSACHSGDGALTAALKGLGLEAPATEEAPPPADAPVARELVRALDCAVLAMRFSVEDPFAIALADQLYRQLFEKKAALPEAMHRATAKAAKTPGTDPLSQATPALFGRRAAGLKLVPPNGAPPVEAAVFEIEEPVRFVGRVEVMTRASAALHERGRTGVLFHGMSGGGKTACAQELAHHLRPIGRFRGWVWWKAPNRGSATSGALAELAQKLDTQLADLGPPALGSGDAELNKSLPKLRAFLEHNAVLVVLDNLESMLTPEGQWLDEQFGRVVCEGLLGHKGVSRTVLTSRVRPEKLPASVLVEAVHALSLAEALLLMRGFKGLGALVRGDAAARALARRVLGVVQGHPKLIELAEGMAADRAGLTAQVEQAEVAWRAGGGRLDAFFREGASAIDAEGFLDALTGWTRAATATLPEAARTLFAVLCAIEESDRESGVLEAVWPHIWSGLGQTGEAPGLAAALAPLTAAALVETEAVNAHVTLFRLHPGVAEAGRADAAPALAAAVDEHLAGFWRAVFDHGRKTEMSGGGGLIRRAGLAAAPYLLRRREWEAAGAMLERVVHRDCSPATVAAVLPRLQAIADGSGAEGDDRLGLRGALATVLLAAGRLEEAEALLREIIDAAIVGGWFRRASVNASDLINLLITTGRAEVALALAGDKVEYSRRAGLGPWTQLGDEARRLQLLTMLGRADEALAAVTELQPRLAALPEAGDADEAVEPWGVREFILNVGCQAAMPSERWEEMLAFNADALASRQARNAPALEIAAFRLNDYFPLLRLGRVDQARAELEACRLVFERENHAGLLGKVLSALGDLENRVHGAAAARRFEEQALRPKYRAGEPESCAISHNNLANYLLLGAGSPAVALGHRLAAGVLFALTASGQQRTLLLPNLARNLAQLGPSAREVVPGSFGEVVERVEALEGVRFRELAEKLNAGRFDLDQLVAELVETGFVLAAEMAKAQAAGPAG